MLDRTRAAVTKQLRGMGCDHFEVGVRHADRGMLLREWAASDIPHGIDWLKRENAHGSDIYIRPARGIKHGMVLVDDLGIGGVQSMSLAGVEPAVVVETSPHNHQVWINLGEPLPDAVRGALARILASRYGGDRNSADHAHFGRLAGFSNRKPEHRTARGAPWVLLHNYPGRACSSAATLVAEASQRLRLHEADQHLQTVLRETAPVLDRSNVRDWYIGVWLSLEEHFGGNFDASRADWMIAGSLFRRGYGFEAVADAVRHYSPQMSTRKAAHTDDYILRTVGKAEIWAELSAQGVSWEKAKDQLGRLAQERARQRQCGLEPG